MQDQTRLDGFPQTNFVGEQHARRVTVRDFLGDVKLMRNQINPPTGKSAYRRLPEAMQHFQ